jgi:hypothetical protein
MKIARAKRARGILAIKQTLSSSLVNSTRQPVRRLGARGEGVNRFSSL